MAMITLSWRVKCRAERATPQRCHFRKHQAVAWRDGLISQVSEPKDNKREPGPNFSKFTHFMSPRLLTRPLKRQGPRMKSVILEPRKLSVAASAHLDLIRASAAWAVMWGHLRALFFVNFEQLPQKNVLLRAFYFLTGLGHQAVMVFFVLSGFLISSTIIKAHVAGAWSWRDYATNRLARLYALLIPGLLLGLLFDKLGGSIFVSTGLYSHPLESLGPGIATARITAGNFLCNLFFLQTIVCPTFGSNGPLWSLANEFWYYVLFPVSLAAALSWIKHSLRLAVLLTVIAFCVAFFLGPDKLIGFLIWMSGCALLIAYSRSSAANRCVFDSLHTTSFCCALRLPDRRPNREMGATRQRFCGGTCLQSVALRRSSNGFRHASHSLL